MLLRGERCREREEKGNGGCKGDGATHLTPGNEVPGR
jgi:hypothetical protein